MLEKAKQHEIQIPITSHSHRIFIKDLKSRFSTLFSFPKTGSIVSIKVKGTGQSLN